MVQADCHKTRDREDARSIVRGQGDRLDDAYVVEWSRRFEAALEDSTLLNIYRQMKKRSG